MQSVDFGIRVRIGLSLDADTQVRVYVDYMMCNESKKDADRKNQQAKMDKINKWRSQ